MLLLMSAAALLPAAGTTGAPSWRSFAGTNYGGGAGMPDVSRADLGFVRDPLGPPWLWSEWPVVGFGPSPQPPQPSHANVTAVRGPFTGQFVYMDFGGTARELKVRYISSPPAPAGVYMCAAGDVHDMCARSLATVRLAPPPIPLRCT